MSKPPEAEEFDLDRDLVNKIAELQDMVDMMIKSGEIVAASTKQLAVGVAGLIKRVVHDTERAGSLMRTEFAERDLEDAVDMTIKSGEIVAASTKQLAVGVAGLTRAAAIKMALADED